MADEIVVEGVAGKVEVKFWHVGDDVRFNFYSDDGNSVYCVGDYRLAKQLGETLRRRQEFGFNEHRFVGKLCWDADGVLFETGDVYSPTRWYTRLNNYQITLLATFLERRVSVGFAS